MLKTLDNIGLTILIIMGVLGLTVLLVGLPVMWLWNALMPELFNLPHISFWQAVGLALLAHLLVGKTTSFKKE